MSMSKMKWNHKLEFKFVLAFILVITILLAGVGWYEMTAYQESVLQIYADQQDSYVQLVLDQINLQPDRTDDEIINDILGSLDKSNKKYWTLSKEQTLVFVKDVTETDRYKGFSTPSLYETKSAKQFLSKLKLNKIIHEIIVMDDEKYVASGVIFHYNEAQYRICLLTNESFVMDNNAFLASKISLYIYIGLLLLVLLLIAMILTNMLSRRDIEMAGLQKRIEEMNMEIEELEDELRFMDRFHTRWSLFAEETIGTFVRKLEERGVKPITMVQLAFESKNSRNEFLEQIQLVFDEKIVRFKNGGQGLILMFVNYKQEDARQVLLKVNNPGKIVKIMSCEQENETLTECFQELMHGN